VATGRLERRVTPTGCCVVLQGSWRGVCRSNRLAAALPRAKTTEHLAGVFAFGLCNAVRRWLHSDTRLHERARAGSVGEFLERGG
jgi:hypothetical protein